MQNLLSISSSPVGRPLVARLLAFKVINHGKISAYKLALFVTWHDSPVWTHSALPGGKEVYVEVGLNSKVQEHETELLKAWIDYHDQYSRQFQISRHLVQRWNTQHHKFSLIKHPVF